MVGKVHGFSSVILIPTLLAVQTGARALRAQEPPPVRPNDPLFELQVSYFKHGASVRVDYVSWKTSPVAFTAEPDIHLGMPEAWTITTGSTDVVVALLDDGFFYRHEDVKDNIWHNPGETGVDDDGYRRETNGVDDDGNGYVDDVIGWDFAFDDPDPDGYVFDGLDATRVQPYRHSIPAMGIIGATGNNGIGIAGINWNVSMMLLKIGAQGTPRHCVDVRRIDRAARAIRYAADNGARMINWSGFVSDFRPERLAILREAIAYAGSKDVLLVVGAGNDSRDIDKPENYMYPACFTLDNILTVAEIDFVGALDRRSGTDRISGSNYGVKNVDVAAIARNYSTEVRHGRSTYGLAGGTSNAGPVAAGVAALVLSVRPDLSAKQLKSILMESAVKLPSLEGRVACGGMISAPQALREAMRR